MFNVYLHTQTCTPVPLLFTHSKKSVSELELACNPVDVPAEKFTPRRLASPQVQLVVEDGKR